MDRFRFLWRDSENQPNWIHVSSFYKLILTKRHILWLSFVVKFLTVKTSFLGVRRKYRENSQVAMFFIIIMVNF